MMETYGLPRELTFEITEKDAPYAPKEQLGKYRVVRWSWFQKQLAQDNASEVIDYVKNISRWRPTIYYAHMILTCVKEHPEGFKLEMPYLQEELDQNVGDILKENCLAVNGITKEKIDAFLRQLGSEKDTPGSPSSGPART